MSPLSPSSQEALTRLRAYSPPPTIYPALPLRQRAAVLLLLFADQKGDLRVVLTLRSATLRTFAGHVALPGGRADNLTETPVQTARREAYEEIGLPLDSHPLPPQFSLEHLTELPLSLTQGFCVRPCVAFLHDATKYQTADVEDSLRLRLDPKEVSSVFTVPLEKFLMAKYDEDGAAKKLDGVPWYTGYWFNWNGRRWKNHEFQAPVWKKASLVRYKVWGLTARILVETARIAYGRNPQFSFAKNIGDEQLIRSMFNGGKPAKEKRPGESAVQKALPGKGLGNL